LRWIASDQAVPEGVGPVAPVGVARSSSTGVVSGDKTLLTVEIAAELHLRATKRQEAGMNGGTGRAAARSRSALHAAIFALRRNALAARRSDA
jgi:hypothetical protein